MMNDQLAIKLKKSIKLIILLTKIEISSKNLPTIEIIKKNLKYELLQQHKTS